MPNELWATNDITDEQYRNSLEYGIAVNTDRALPNAYDGLKPVAKRILYDMWETGTSSNKPHKKSARVVGDTMGKFHPHGQDAIYGAAVRLTQDWTLRYPLIDGHGNFGNIDGDPPAAMRYSEIRLTKLAEEGLLSNLKKQNVIFGDNYDETEKEPISLPSIFPNLLCNPNEGIGWAMSCTWGCHNLNEVAKIIFDYIDGTDPAYLAPDFPTGGTILVKPKDIENIVKTGRGSIKIRGNYIIEGQNIVFTELPYGTHTEALMSEIGQNCENGNIIDVVDIRNESNKNGLRLVIEVAKNGDINNTVKKLFEKTNLQTSFSYNQMALVNKTPTELNLKDCCKIYVDYNIECIVREAQFNLNKTTARAHIVQGLLKALEDIDNIITLIKKSSSGKEAKDNLIKKYAFSDEQAKAILAMKLSSLANLEKVELQNEYQDLNKEIEELKALIGKEENQKKELKNRLQKIVNEYGDARRTKIVQIEEEPKEEKEIINVEPEKCVVITTSAGNIKRIPASSFKVQKRNTKGVKTQDDIVQGAIRTNTIDSLMIFSDKGKMYRLLVDNIPVGTNTSKGQSIKSLITMEPNESPAVIYSIYRDTDAQFVLFATKNGLIKKTPLTEYQQTKKNTGLGAIKFKDGDELVSVSLVKDEPILLITAKGMAIQVRASDIPISSRLTIGVKGIALGKDDYVVCALPVRDSADNLAIFSESSNGKKMSLSDFPAQGRGGKGTICYKGNDKVVAGTLVSDEDSVLILGDRNSVCVSAKDIPSLGKTASGNIMIKGSHILNITKT